MISKDFTLDTFKRKCSKISDFLKSKGHNVPISTLHHALSLMLDENNWNTLKPKLETKKESLIKKNDNLLDIYDMAIKEKTIREIYEFFFSRLFPIKDSYLFEKEIKDIAKKINVVDFEQYFMPQFFLTDNNLSKHNVIGDEDLLKISLLDNIENSEKLKFISQALMLITTPGNINSSDLSSCISREPMFYNKINNVKRKNYLYIFFDEGELSNRLYDFNKNNNFGASASGSGGYKIIDSEAKKFTRNSEGENLVLASSKSEQNDVDSINGYESIKIKTDTISVKYPLPELIKFFNF